MQNAGSIFSHTLYLSICDNLLPCKICCYDMAQEIIARANQCKYVRTGPNACEMQSSFATLAQRLENWIFILLEPFFLRNINGITKSHVTRFMAFSEPI